ncbi:hypothetical protein BP6252_12626 [Coleophoma cylindrospora]|uniref:Derlin n=1 Tax=Coleophoma cylindrospora TaxID=1849047 RepID=A0A3D8QCM2_9HELO|nr:hypothetical protein BP6252_12626 [Coleophoma cylindrospora]
MSPLDVFFSAPPISRTLAAVAFTISLLTYTNVIPFHFLNLTLQSLIQLPPELWRILTSLLITSPMLGILFDTYFLYVFGAKLETASPRFAQRADFFYYICFECLVILLLNLLIAGGSIFASPISLSFICTSTRDSWDQPITFFVIKLPSQYLPYAILLLTLIIAGPQAAMVQATGLIAAHLYDLLTGLYPSLGIKSNLIPTPAWAKKIFGTQAMMQRPYGTVFMPTGGASTTGSAAWGLDLSWRRFGEGRRLGGEGESSLPSQRPRGLVLAAMVMAAFMVICAFLGLWFFWDGVPDGWRSAIGAGRSPGTTLPN